MASEIRVGDTGTKFLVTVKDENGDVKDVSTAGTLELIFQKPNGDILTKTASFDSDGTDGKIYYTTSSEDVDKAGLWRLQSYVVIGTDEKKTNIDSFRVYPNLE